MLLQPSTALNINSSSLNLSYNNQFTISSGSLSLASGYGVRKATGTLTAGGTSATVTHNFNTRDVVVNVYDASTYDTVETDVVRTDLNNVAVNISAAYANNLSIVIVG